MQHEIAQRAASSCGPSAHALRRPRCCGEQNPWDSASSARLAKRSGADVCEAATPIARWPKQPAGCRTQPASCRCGRRDAESMQGRRSGCGCGRAGGCCSCPDARRPSGLTLQTRSARSTRAALKVKPGRAQRLGSRPADAPSVAASAPSGAAPLGVHPPAAGGAAGSCVAASAALRLSTERRGRRPSRTSGSKAWQRQPRPAARAQMRAAGSRSSPAPGPARHSRRRGMWTAARTLAGA